MNETMEADQPIGTHAAGIDEAEEAMGRLRISPVSIPLYERLVLPEKIDLSLPV